MRRTRVLALVLALSLALPVSPALAAEGAGLFPAVADYPGFADVAEGDWFFPAVKLCCEAGLMNGTGGGAFTPAGVLTVAEAATLAARIRAERTGAEIPRATPLPGESRAWYQDYLDYLSATLDPAGDAYFASIPWDAPETPATRQQFLALLMLGLREEGGGFPDFPAINAIDTLPDVAGDPVVLFFYNAGILTGVDDYGTFAGERTLQRSEAAAMAARVADPSLRQTFVPAAPPEAQPQPSPEPALSYEEELMGTMAFLLNGNTVTIGQFVQWLGQTVYQTDANLYAQTGRRLDLSGQTDYGVGDLNQYFIDATLARMERQLVLELAAKSYGATPDTLAQALTPAPTYDQLSAYAQQSDLLGAKHILIATTDAATGAARRSDAEALAIAQTVLDGFQQDPTAQQFDNLMALYGEDPGMTAYPEGYLFTAGEMVAEFESAVRALAVGEYTAEPVKSAYGYHIILRLDPARMSQTVTAYQDAVLAAQLDAWLAQATVTVNTVELYKLDVAARYQQYLQSLAT